MKLLYLLLLLIPNFSFGQIDSFCAEKFKQGKEAGDSLINAKIDYMVWDDWNIIQRGIRHVKYFRCEVENYYSYNQNLYQEYAKLLMKDSIFLFPYFNFFEGDCFVEGAKTITDSILKMNGFDEKYFNNKKKAAIKELDEYNDYISHLFYDGEKRSGGEISKKYGGSIEKVIIDFYMQSHNYSLPPFYFTSFMNWKTFVFITVSVNKQGIVDDVVFGNFSEDNLRQNETVEQIELLKQIISQSLLNRQVFTPFKFNGKRTEFEERFCLTICWK
jgi:hypothetical protein